jgi:hypothetical protein
MRYINYIFHVSIVWLCLAFSILSVNGQEEVQVSLTSPVEGSALKLTDQPVIFKAEVRSSGVRIEKVQFKGSIISTSECRAGYDANNIEGVLGISSQSPYVMQWNIPNFYRGCIKCTLKVALVAEAIDEQGKSWTSSPANVSLLANNRPYLRIVSPEQYVTYRGPIDIPIRVEALDDKSVNRVEFYNGTTKLGDDFTSPYEMVLPNAIAGLYDISAIAVDNEGLSSFPKRITVRVTNSIPPQVKITSPVDQSTIAVTDSVTLSADTIDMDGSTVKVQFFVNNLRQLPSPPPPICLSPPQDFISNFENNIKLVGELSSPPYKIVVPGSLLYRSGTSVAEIYAIATDNEGGTTKSAPITIRMVQEHKPIVEIVSPIKDTILNGPVDVLFKANVSVRDAKIKNVSFTLNWTLLDEFVEGPYEIKWYQLPPGNHILKVTAVDDRGGTTTSAVNFTVLGDTSISLNKGWNLMSLPLQPIEYDAAKILSSIAGKYSAVYTWHNETQKYLQYIPDDPGIRNLWNLESRKGYWIYMKEAAVLKIKGVLPQTYLDLRAGWNLAGYNSSVKKNFPVFSSEKDIAMIFAWDSKRSEYLSYNPQAKSNTLTSLGPGMGFWIYVPKDTSLNMNGLQINEGVYGGYDANKSPMLLEVTDVSKIRLDYNCASISGIKIWGDQWGYVDMPVQYKVKENNQEASHLAQLLGYFKGDDVVLWIRVKSKKLTLGPFNLKRNAKVELRKCNP